MIAALRPMIRTLSAFLVIPLVAAAGVALLHASGAGSTMSAQSALQRASHSYDGLVASLGPNTTYHEIDITHDAINQHGAVPFELPEDYRTDTWAVFDSRGAAITIESRVVSADGSLYSYTTWDGAQTISTDARFGTVQRQTVGTVTADQLAGAIRRIQTPDAAKYSSAKVLSSTFDGRPVYIVDLTADAGTSRTYIDRRTYRRLRDEAIVPGAYGPMVTRSDDVTVEVLSGNRAPSLAELKTAGTAKTRR